MELGTVTKAAPIQILRWALALLSIPVLASCVTADSMIRGHLAERWSCEEKQITLTLLAAAPSRGGNHDELYCAQGCEREAAVYWSATTSSDFKGWREKMGMRVLVESCDPATVKRALARPGALKKPR
jgi:hypothetical protein